jgi:predicted enzyme related to lactoylglutathione lyase
MVEFYSKTFGWRPNILGPEMGNYVVVETSERDPVTKFPKKPGMINGGLYPKSADNPHPGVVIAVDDIAEAMKNIEMAGGKIIGFPVDIPGTGTYVSFTDTEGNRLSILKPLPM